VTPVRSATSAIVRATGGSSRTDVVLTPGKGRGWSAL
jgi:hypothetical protein